MLLKVYESCLLVVDVQERLLSALAYSKQVIDNSRVLIKVATELDVPVFVSEQYPKGLGHTDAGLQTCLEAAKATIMEKMDFSCYRDKNIRKELEKIPERKQLVICGVETHVCVLQTAVEFQQAGHDVFVVMDAVTSRKAESEHIACLRMQQERVRMVSTEMVVFEWMGKAGTNSFRKLSALIK